MKVILLFFMISFVLTNISDRAECGRGSSIIGSSFENILMKKRGSMMARRSHSSFYKEYKWNGGAVPKVKNKREKITTQPTNNEVHFDSDRSLYFYYKKTDIQQENEDGEFRVKLIDKSKVVFTKD